MSHFHAIPRTKPIGCYRGEVKCSFGLELPILNEFFPSFFSDLRMDFNSIRSVNFTVLGTIKNPKLGKMQISEVVIV